MRRKRHGRLITGATLVLLFPFAAVLACGPDYPADVFITAEHPLDQQRYVAGQLGILQPTYRIPEKVVAWRYLSGAPLSDKERAAYLVIYPPSLPARVMTPADWQKVSQANYAALPVNQWLAARNQFAVKPPPGLDASALNTVVLSRYSDEIDRMLNCTDGSFLTAIATLRDRASRWGATSPELSNWLDGQDAVFSNCAKPNAQPAPAPAGSSALLQQDRAYQIAAAEFYNGSYDMARDAFAAIAKDVASPWSRWGDYLAARAVVRQAATVAPRENTAMAVFDQPSLADAATRLRQIIAHPPDAEIRHAAESELSFVQVRLDPAAHLREVSDALAGPKPDPEFAQHLADLSFLRSKGVGSESPLLSWMDANQPTTARQPGPDAAAVAAEGEAHPGLPWLLTAIEDATKPEPALMQAAAAVPASSPGYLSINYHRARLLAQSGRDREARALATDLLSTATTQHDVAAENALHGARMQAAESMRALLVDAPRTMIETQSEVAAQVPCSPAPKTSAGSPCLQKIPRLQFDEDTAKVFNAAMPLSRWMEAARSPVLPEHLQMAMAWSTWLRAVLLDDTAVARQAAALLPAGVRPELGDGSASLAARALLGLPGVLPYLQQGVQRSITFDRMDEYRENWWCEPASGDRGTGARGSYWTEARSGENVTPPKVVFLSAAEKEAAARERARLDAAPFGVTWIGRRVIQDVKAHPGRNDNPELLWRVVEATHYGCYPPARKQEQTEVSKEAYDLLHRHYAHTEYAMKTKYYY